MNTPARWIVFPAKGKVALQSVDIAPPDAGELLARTHYSLMSIGTETTILHQRYEPGSHFDRMFSFPQRQTGVQAIGEVLQVGDEVDEFKPGELVYMRLAHRSHTRVAAEQCSPVPAGLDLTSACWAGLAKTAFRAAWAARFGLGGKVLIIGAGPVGQMAIRWARAAGMAEIIVVDPAEPRLLHAERGGATQTIANNIGDCLGQLAQINKGAGPDLVVDTTGNAEVFQRAQACAAKFGKLILLGDTGYPSRQKFSSHVMSKGLSIQATHDSHDRDGWSQRKIDQLFFQQLGDGQFDVSGLITDQFRPQDCEQAYQLAEQERERVMGLLFDWTDIG